MSDDSTGTAVQRQGLAPEPASVGRLDELYRRHMPDAVRLAYLLTGNRHLAQDLAQDAFVKLGWRVLHLRRPDAFGPYLRKTVVNLARMAIRRERIGRAAVARGRATPTPTDPDLADREAVRRALGTLPERQRIAVVLRFYEDLSYEQIAEHLRCRPGTVGSLLYRAMQTLREEMEGH
jgi:RNA polymerase sigma-70 factor (sigma-E family)